MLPASFVKGYDQRRLRNVLVVLFLLLTLPTAAVIWQAWDQLKWESWYQYRGQAEALARRIDLELTDRTGVAEARSFTDFAFLNTTSSTNVLSRSPLSALPVPQDVPGAIGYFQVDPLGRFSTPLLPNDGDWRAAGLNEADALERTVLAERIQSILADNQLLGPGSASAVSSGRLQIELLQNELASDDEDDDRNYSLELQGFDMPDAAEEARISTSGLRSVVEQEEESGRSDYSQRMFDQLNQPAEAFSSGAAPASVAVMEESVVADQARPVEKIRDLQLDDELVRKNEGLSRQGAFDTFERKESPSPEPARARRVEQSELPAAPAEAEATDVGAADRAMATAGTIATFESEIDPFQFSLLDSGHLVLFRNVWRDGSRYIQGLLIDQAGFAESAVNGAFRSTTLFDMSDLVIGYHGDVLQVIRGGDYESLASNARDLDGSLLYRGNLSAPFDSLELVFSINHLPPGPGSRVLIWTTLIIAIVFTGGFLALYRLGVGQIRLARQQQDFVSAVSHELKTPLTSIRMYGEMLKEGWADEEKQKQYYEFIHDESERLTRLISNVLQLARITRNEPQFDAKPVQVSELLDQVRSKIANHVERAGFTLNIAADEAAARQKISVDEDCFAQIVINLVDNAVKFSRDADTRRIDIDCRLDTDNNVALSVRDHGPGIDRRQLKKIFELFYRSESELTRETVGTGIGLAIVHQLVNAMGGFVDVVNREPGAEFRVTFPALTS